MTLRALFVILGIMTALPPLAFLILFQPPKEKFRSIVFAQRLQALALVGVGARIVVGSLTKLDQPIVFANAFDKWTTLATIVFCAVAAVAALFSYVQSRQWW